MAIEGPLRELALVDVLQLVYLSQKTGALSVRGKESTRPALLLFENGAVVGARAPGEANRIGRLLIMARAATAAQVEAALTEQRRHPDRRLGALLVEQGVSAAEVRRQLSFQVEETLFQLVRWTDGYFHFEETAPPDPGPIKLSLSAESLLLEALRRIDEWSELASGAPDTTLVPRLVDGRSSSDGALHLAPQEWEVLAMVDGELTLRKMAHELGRAEFDVAKAVFSLASAGVIELGARVPGARHEALSAAGFDGEAKEVERELRAGRLDAAELSLGELAVRHPGRGEVELLRGRLAGMRGRWDAAVEALETAVRRDPLLAAAYYHLGMAAVRVGKLKRAEEAFATCARLPDAQSVHRERAVSAVPLLTGLWRLLQEEE